MPDLRTLGIWIRKASAQSPAATVRKVAEKVQPTVQRVRERRRDHRRPTYALDAGALPVIARCVEDAQVFSVPDPSGTLGEVVGHYLLHEFDLLGSGWVHLDLGAASAGFAGHRFAPQPRAQVGEPNKAESQRIWRLVDPGYRPIDWQRDVRSGWRWRESTWFRDLVIGPAPGADIKLPWELGRLQHLPQLALATIASRRRTGGFADSDAYVREFRNQVLDYVAWNPPRFGATWGTAMDAAIRATNLLIARDLMLAAGVAFDRPFDDVLRRSILEHGRHIVANLEWDPVLRGNHYLADVAGLAIVATFLPEAREASEWLELAFGELRREIDLQFNLDGSSFEGSTSYHRLSTELVIFAVAALLGDDRTRGRLPAALGPQIRRMVDFSIAMTGPTGRVAQIGDNDSGRLLKLVPQASEESLDQRHLMDAALGLLDPGSVSWSAPPPGPDRIVVEALARGRRLDGQIGGSRSTPTVVGDRAALEAVRARIHSFPPHRRASYLIPAQGDGLVSGLSLTSFPDGGYWVARSPRLHLVIRCGPVGHRGFGGHDHNDQLSFDLTVDGSGVIKDPGTFVYTASEASRNAYRSAQNHSGPLTDGPEPAGFDLGPFILDGARPGECLAWGVGGFAGRHVDRRNVETIAVIEWTEGGVRVDHGVVGASLHGARVGAGWEALRSQVPFSPGYGVQDV